jgi:hypothetical protein
VDTYLGCSLLPGCHLHVQRENKEEVKAEVQEESKKEEAVSKPPTEQQHRPPEAKADELKAEEAAPKPEDNPEDNPESKAENPKAEAAAAPQAAAAPKDAAAPEDGAAPEEAGHPEAKAEKGDPEADAEMPISKAEEAGQKAEGNRGAKAEKGDPEAEAEKPIPTAKEAAVTKALEVALADRSDGAKVLGRAHISSDNLTTRDIGLPTHTLTAVRRDGGGSYYSNLVQSGVATFLVTAGGSEARDSHEAFDLSSLFQRENVTNHPSPSSSKEEEESQYAKSILPDDNLRCHLSIGANERQMWRNVTVYEPPFKVSSEDRPSQYFVLVTPCDVGHPWRKTSKETIVVHVSRLLCPARQHKHFNVMEVRCTRTLC